MPRESDRIRALVGLGRALSDAGYAFVTVSPETHRRVDARARAAGRATAVSLRDAFGWSRPFAKDLLSPAMADLAHAAGILVPDGDLVRSTVRFSSIGERLFVHSAYPTVDAQAVFFGPDTYRFCDALRTELAGRPPADVVVDVGCGSGAGGIIASGYAKRVVLGDVNVRALELASVNAQLARVDARTEIVESDVLSGVTGPIDLVVANPPYMVDPRRRAYRDGGGSFGEALAVRIAREALARLAPGGRLVLYTGAAVAFGADTFLASVRGVLDEAGARFTYREMDPDVFGDEIETNDAYAEVERIAAVVLTADR